MSLNCYDHLAVCKAEKGWLDVLDRLVYPTNMFIIARGSVQ